MADDEKILSIVRLSGPVLPVDIARGMKTNILLASAYLSELVSRKKINISSVKVGGSPLYFMPGQEAKLDKFAENLNEKEFRAYEVLKEKGVLRDNQLTPLMRVALRQISDFAAPLTVTFEGKQELFWKWHLTKDEEATLLIRKELGIEEKKEEVIAPKVAELEKVKEITEEIVPEVKKEGIQKEAAKPKRGRKKKENGILKEKPFIETKKEPKEEKFKVAEIKKEPKNFIDAVQEFFKNKDISVVSEEMIQKNKEINYIVKIPSPIGALQYLCKVKNKRSSTDKDVSSALVEGQLKKMPVVFLHSGNLNPKAQELVKTEPFKTMTFFKLENGS